ncbi:zinc metalloprotease HtpX, partial [Escherichia coli]|nr:zinc metalloprotease HtpX [Escherichia coli]
MDFRNVIRKNNIRTRLVVVSYIFIMLIVGLLVDTATHPDEWGGFFENMLAFATFKRFPVAT